MTNIAFVDCAQCGTPFRRARKSNRFCSRSCASKARPMRPGRSNPNWRGGKTDHPLYMTYGEMVARCTRPTHKRFADYGGRGITVCERWLSDFWSFVADMGERPSGMSLDRIDNDGNYEPDNCRWATDLEQRHNRRAEEPRTHCAAGHEYTPDNTRVTTQGTRQCRACQRRYSRESQQRRRQQNGV